MIVWLLCLYSHSSTQGAVLQIKEFFLCGQVNVYLGTVACI